MTKIKSLFKCLVDYKPTSMCLSNYPLIYWWQCKMRCGPMLLTVGAVYTNFICDRLLNYSRSVLNIITRYCFRFTSKVKEIGKKEKHPERGDWDIHGGRGGD